MALASLWFTDGTFKPIDPDKAVEIWNCLNGHTEPSEKQAEFLNTVKNVFIPPSYRSQAKGYKEAHGLVPDPTFIDKSGASDTWVKETQGKAAASGKD